MKLHRVEIKNFRSIADATIHFAPSCRILVGLNESGKSNILRALSFLHNERMPDAADRREPLPNESDIGEKDCYACFVFRLEKEEREKIAEAVASLILAKANNPSVISIGNKKKTIGELCSFYKEGLYDVNVFQKTKSSMYWSESATWGDPTRVKPLAGWKSVAKNCQKEIVVNVGGKREPLTNYCLVNIGDFPDIPESALVDMSVDSITSLIGEEVRKIVDANLPNVLFWRYSAENILPAEVRIDKFVEKPDICVPLKNMFTLAGCRDIGASIKQHRADGSSNRFQNFLDRVANKTTQHFQLAWKDYEFVEFTLTDRGEVIAPGVKEQHPNVAANTYNFADRSEGFKRFVTFLLMVSANVEIGNIRNTLLLIDEPETSLHPTAARALRDLLVKISSKNLVVYSTHSTHMIDPEKIGRHYIVTKTDEKTCAEKAEGGKIMDEEVLYNALGVSVFDTLKPNNIIFEGWRDKYLFKVALEKALPDIKKKYKEIGFCHVLGVKDVRNVAPTIELAGMDCIVISDSDNTARERQDKHGEKRMAGQWFNYQNIDDGIEAKTGEDFIRNGYIAKKVNGVLAEKEIPDMKAEDLPPKKNKWGAIHKWLNIHEIPEEEREDKLRKIKNAIFDGLKPADIDMAEYEKLLRGILLKIGKKKK